MAADNASLYRAMIDRWLTAIELEANVGPGTATLGVETDRLFDCPFVELVRHLAWI